MLVLHDACSLCNFGAVDAVELCARQHGHLPVPRWVEQVREEIIAGREKGAPECEPVLRAEWLGAPIVPELGDLAAIFRLQIGCNAGARPAGTRHLGEAQSLYFAQKLDAAFVTDDNGAHAFAVRRIGPDRVMDTVDILRNAVSAGDVTAQEACELAHGMIQKGRRLRHVHRGRLRPAYFQQA